MVKLLSETVTQSPDKNIKRRIIESILEAPNPNEGSVHNLTEKLNIFVNEMMKLRSITAANSFINLIKID